MRLLLRAQTAEQKKKKEKEGPECKEQRPSALLARTESGRTKPGLPGGPQHLPVHRRGSTTHIQSSEIWDLGSVWAQVISSSTVNEREGEPWLLKEETLFVHTSFSSDE